MYYKEILEKIRKIGRKQPDVHTVIDDGDIFSLNTDNKDIVYSAICVESILSERLEGDIVRHTVRIYYIDRILDDRSNEEWVVNAGYTVLNNMINAISEEFEFEFEYPITFTEFFQRFEAVCAGVYADVKILHPVGDTCSHKYPKDSFNEDYNNDFN